MFDNPSPARPDEITEVRIDKFCCPRCEANRKETGKMLFEMDKDLDGNVTRCLCHNCGFAF
jgi:transposase-like protein